MFKSVLVPVDGSETSERAIEKAVEIAQACGAKGVLLGSVSQYVVEQAKCPVLVVK